jgi:pimeloyl-ACP methyl ester carboxylesterase
VTVAGFTNDGWHFDVSDAGDPGGRCVILLHGFPADRQCWEEITPGLNAAGYRTLAPDQRGYSPGARPRGRRSYRMAALMGDVLALADQAHVDRFDVVGHDWGAAVAWGLAAHHPERVRSLTALSVPHPAAFAQAVRHADQLRRSWYMGAFQLPVVPELLLGARQATQLRNGLQRDGLSPAAAARYAQRARDGAMTGPLNWYRALPLDARQRVPKVKVATMYVWSDGDGYVTRRAADACGPWMKGPARRETLRGVSHWIPEVAPARTTELLLEHLAGVNS